VSLLIRAEAGKLLRSAAPHGSEKSGQEGARVGGGRGKGKSGSR